MSGARTALLAAAASVLFLLAAAPAASADSADGEYVVLYDATASVYTVGPDGAAPDHQPDESGGVRLTCTDTLCTVAEAPGSAQLVGMEFDPHVGTVTKDFPGKDNACVEDQPSPSSITLLASASSFSAILDMPHVGWDDCGGGTRIYTHEYVSTWRGTGATGDVCVFAPEGCHPPTPTPTPEAEATIIADAPADPQPASAGSSFLDTGAPEAPSVLSTLPAPGEAGTAPSQLLLAAVLTVVLVLLVSLPTSLLNSAVEAGSGRFSDWWAGRRGRGLTVGGGAVEAADAADAAGPAEAAETPDASVAGHAVDAPHVDGGADAANSLDAADSPAGTDAVAEAAPAATRWNRTWWWAAAGVAAASVISAFVDPEFGVNIGSARVILSILVSFAIDVVLGWLLVVWVVRRLNPGVTHSYAFQPLTLIVVLAAVLFTRITGFEPGIVFGLVAGVAFGLLAGKAQEARAALTTLGYAFVVALLAWLVYGAIGGGAAAGESFWGTFLVETLSSIAIGGMAALPIALFPLRGLAGHAVWSWNRWIWAACYAIGLFSFFVVLMPMPFSWEGVDWDLWAWIGVYLAYAAFAVVAWLLLARPWQKETDETEPAAPEQIVVAAGGEPSPHDDPAADAPPEAR